MPDLIIRNATVIDGSGEKAFAADIAITGDKIEKIATAGELLKTQCPAIDATGKVLCPGFIDVHSHADFTSFRADHPKVLAPLVRQGITTYVGGNCGMGMAPFGGPNSNAIRDYIEAFSAIDISKSATWDGVDGFMDHLDKNGILLNTAMLAPHGMIRIYQMGLANRYATVDEISAMSRQLETYIAAGAIGMSTGLQYFPGSQSDTRELVALGKVLKKYNAIFTSHLRSYSNTLPLAVDEVVEVCRENAIPGQISHIFWVPDFGRFGRPIRAVVRGIANMSKYWTPPIPLDGEEGKQIDKLDKLRENGSVDVKVDVMPTTTGFTHMFAFFPPWVLTGTMPDILARLRDPETRKKIYRDIVTAKTTWPHVEDNTWSMNFFKIMGWGSVTIMSVQSEKNKHFEGMNLVDVAKERKQHPFDAACDLLLEEDARVMIFESMAVPDDNFTERSAFHALRHPQVMITSDTILMGFGKPSYLFSGCFPKFLARYVREKKMLALETAIWKTTGLPATHFRLKKRGFIKEGYFADLLLIDPATIAPNVNFETPTGIPSGIHHVFINGRHVLDEGNLDTSTLAGRLLRRDN